MVYKFDTTPQRSEIMRKIKSTGTKPEELFAKGLWGKSIRYRRHSNALPGNPDISIKKYKLAVFIDGEFWHGHKWRKKKNKIKANRGYWIKKIEKNIKRDKVNKSLLQKEGWKVFRFWQHEVEKDLEGCLKKVLKYIDTIKE